jgi:iron complex outermembrane receptor protein
LPSYTDLYYHDPANLGSPFLRPESAWGYDAAVEWTSGKRLHGDIGVFHQRVHDGIDYVRASSTDLWRAANINRVQLTGVEASLSIQPSRLQSVEVRYTGLHGVRDALNGLQSRYTFNYPVHDATVTWQASLPAGFLARTRVGVLSRYEREPYAVWDVYIADRRGRWAPFVQLTNLTSTSYQEVLGVVMPGRAVVAGVDYRFGF